jgi:hypothetical protein
MRGRKLVVQLLETFGEKMAPTFVESLDAIKYAERLNLPLAPVMIYGDDVTHIVTEEGIANLLLCRDASEREQAIRGVAGYTAVGRARDRGMVAHLRERAVIRRAGGSGYRSARCRSQTAGGKIDQGSGAMVGRAVSAAAALSQLVGDQRGNIAVSSSNDTASGGRAAPGIDRCGGIGKHGGAV